MKGLVRRHLGNPGVPSGITQLTGLPRGSEQLAVCVSVSCLKSDFGAHTPGNLHIRSPDSVSEKDST